MAEPTLSQNLVPAEPQLQDLLDLLKKDIMMNFAAHHIGTVQSFNAQNQTATATINYKKTYFERDAATGLYRPVLVDYPILIDCPCIVLGGGPASLTFPISEGDECLVLFNDRDIDNWFKSGQIGPVASSRLHSISDALILVGVRSLPKVLADYDLTRAKLQWGETVVGVSESLVRIANQQYTLNTLLQELIGEINDLVNETASITVTAVMSGGGTSGPPANAAAITAIASQISATAAKIGDLLE